MFRLFLSDLILINGDFYNGGIVVNKDGRIDQVFKDHIELDEWLDSHRHVETYDYTGLVIMPGLIDSHVHINEPGRTQWEGFETATKAAAAGGFTTIVDMPLNSIPPTTTVNNLLEKHEAAEDKICVDVGFWGGIVPGNEKELRKMIDQGVVGFKCFLCPSGVDEFPNVTEDDIELAYKQLDGMNGLIAFHAEKCHGDEETNGCSVKECNDEDDVHEFKTYLKTRPPSLEVNAIEMITRIARKYDGIRTHIVHLSAASALPLIKNFRSTFPNRLTVETCHHYLSINADEVPRNRVDFKCCPPVRDLSNQKALWDGIKNGHIDMIVSDHSPSTAEMKLLVDGPDYGNFMKSWGGISSVQFGLSLFWTKCVKYGLGINDMIRLMCEQPAKLCSFDDRKGKIAKGYDADFCIWDPSAEFTVTSDMIHFRNKANPYMGKQLNGLVHATIVRGQFAYKRTNTEIFNCVGRLLASQRHAIEIKSK